MLCLLTISVGVKGVGTFDANAVNVSGNGNVGEWGDISDVVAAAAAAAAVEESLQLWVMLLIAFFLTVCGRS